jgi:hypothetical protein
MREFRIYIYADPAHTGQCLVDWPVATLWKSARQTVTWVSDDGGEYTVDFNMGLVRQSPFSKPTFNVPKNGEKPSGYLTDLAQSDKYYDYGIKDENGTPCKKASTDPDPGLYVK